MSHITRTKDIHINVFMHNVVTEPDARVNVFGTTDFSVVDILFEKLILWFGITQVPTLRKSELFNYYTNVESVLSCAFALVDYHRRPCYLNLSLRG